MQGFESQLCTNYLGHFLLTHLLLPVLLTAGENGKPGRVVSFLDALASLDFKLSLSQRVIHLFQIFSKSS